MKLILFVLMLIGSITTVSSQYVASQTPTLKFLSSSNFIDAKIIFMKDVLKKSIPNEARLKTHLT